MSKEKRAKNKRRVELRNRTRQLEALIVTAANPLAAERYSKELVETKRELVRLN